MAPGEHELPVGTIATGAKDPLVDVAPIEPRAVRGPASPGSHAGDCPGRPSPSGDHEGALAVGGGEEAAIGRQDTATSQPGERGEPNQTVTVAVAEVWDKPMGFYL